MVLIDSIRGEHEFAATYGSPRVWLELPNRGVNVGRKRVARIMRAKGRKGAYLRRGWKHGSPGNRGNSGGRAHRVGCRRLCRPWPRRRHRDGTGAQRLSRAAARPPQPRAALAGLDRFAARLPGAHTRLAQQLQALGYRVTLEHAA